MSVIMHKEAGKACPRCGLDEISRLDLVDPGYGARNGLTETEILDISEAGEFTMDVCKACGFKWVENMGIASTSQIKSALHLIVLTHIADAEDSELEEMIDELISVGAIKKNKEKDFVISPRGGNDDVKLELIKVFLEYSEGCDVDTLVEIYNQHFTDEIVEAAESTDNDSFYTAMDAKKTLDANAVIIDD